MSATSGDQLDLLEPASEQLRPKGTSLLGLVLDQDAFLQFLSSEWLVQSSGQMVLGTELACGTLSPDAAGVAVWFDAEALPDYTVMAWRDGQWCETTLRGVRSADTIVAWSGPLPAFAVDHFHVGTDAVRSKLLALARNFADIEVPTQPFEVGSLSQVAPPREAPPGNSPWQPPTNWDALRGAAAMAAFAVPAIDPWIDLFCDLVRNGVSKPEHAEHLRAPWLRAALWSYRMEQEEPPALWRAIVAEFSRRGRLQEWRARTILEDICEHARRLGEDEERLARLFEGAMSLLEDRGTIEDVGSHDDFLALTLQLLLLRPSPDRFIGWREDWSSIPPVVWWTGMTLAGYLQGFKSLPKELRGTQECRRLMALKTWQHACSDGSGPWHSLTPDVVGWHVDTSAIVMTADAKPWAEHKLGTRGSWYRASFDHPTIQDEARTLAQEECPEALEQVVAISDARIQFLGSGTVKAVAKERTLTVTGRVELPLGHGLTIEHRLNIHRFKRWLATAAIARRLKRPSVETPSDSDHSSAVLAGKLGLAKVVAKKQPAKRALTRTNATKSNEPPAGLQLLPDFITYVEEADLIAIIDSLEWDRSMKRRVQHYGWRYDYKARQVVHDNYLGPLPDWAQRLAVRLHDLEVVSEVPDQVIVNNYDGAQGITKHIDCRECFRGPVVTISLLETWDMVFTRKLGEETVRFVQQLPRCSAAVLDQEARSVWQHEIPERLTEHGVPRGRRVSITFRKVAA